MVSYKALKYVKRKHKVFQKYTKHPACRRAAIKVSNELKKAKVNFERKLAENITKMIQVVLCVCSRTVKSH